MIQDYRRTQTTVSNINYHFVFCPRYRRKIYLIDGIEAWFKELIYQICERHDLVVLALECHIDHCHLFVNAPPKASPAQTMLCLKGWTASVLGEELPSLNKAKQLWTRSYFVSTAGDVSSETIQRYIKTQKARGRSNAYCEN
jgi:putative transposase